MAEQSTSNELYEAVASGKWLSRLPILLIGLTAGVLVAAWGSIPERWPSHYGLDGQPDAWADRSIGAVFMPVGIAFAMWLFFEVLVVGIRGTLARRVADADDRPAMLDIARGTMDLLRLVEAGVVSVVCIFAVVMPLIRPTVMEWAVIVGVGVPVVFSAVGVWRLSRTTTRVRPRGGPKVEHWDGLRYHNPSDPRLFVPKRLGPGMTLNFGHKRARLVLALILSVPATALLLAFLLLTR